MATSKQCMYVYMFYMFVHACVLCGVFYLLRQDVLTETALPKHSCTYSSFCVDRCYLWTGRVKRTLFRIH